MMMIWVTCETHAARFPVGFEDGHRAGPLGEQNSTGECVLVTDEVLADGGL